MILAAIPYAALQIDRGVRALLRGFGGVPLVALLLLIAAAVPLSLEGARQQPVIESVDGLRDGVSRLSGWVRMSGRIVTLTSPQSLSAGQSVQSLLIEPSGDAILLLSHRTLEQETTVTGRVATSANASQTARSVAGPRLPDEELDIVDRYVLTVDDPIVPPRERDWTIVWAPLVTAGVLVAGRLAGYPVLRRRDPATESAAGARPLQLGEGMALRVVEREEETGLRLRAPRGELRRLARSGPTDPYFSLAVAGRERPLLFRRHRWSTANAVTLWTVLDRAPAVELRDWGIEVLLAFDSEADRERVLAGFAERDDADS